jgi:hypothetical protein
MIPAAVRNEWYPVAMAALVPPAPGRETQVLGRPVRVFRDGARIRVQGDCGADLAVTERFGHVWACPGTPAHPLFTIPEAD